MDMKKKRLTPAALIQRRIPGLDPEKAAEIISKVKARNNGTLKGLSKEHLVIEAIKIRLEYIGKEFGIETVEVNKNIEDSKALDGKTCPLCFKILSDKQTRDRHIVNIHGDKQKDASKIKVDPSALVKCNHCEKVFKHSISLKRHMKIHEIEEDSFSCDECNKTFSRKDNLTKHRRKIHSVYNINFDAAKTFCKDKIECKLCGTDFGTDFQMLYSHLASRTCQETEGKKMDKTCPLCFHKFANKQSRDRHVQNQHSQRNKQNSNTSKVISHSIKETCPSCGKIFSHKVTLMRHMKEHESSGDTFSCDRCNKNFSRKDNLDMHQRRIHNIYNINFNAARNQDNLVCQMCGADFGDDSHMFDSHLAHRTCKATKEEKMKREIDITCPLCLKKFASIQSRDRHVKSRACQISKNESEIEDRTEKNAKLEFQCDLCEKSYHSEKEFMNHLNWKHRNQT